MILPETGSREQAGRKAHASSPAARLSSYLTGRRRASTAKPPALNARPAAVAASTCSGDGTPRQVRALRGCS
jgi:hypothetical protein